MTKPSITALIRRAVELEGGKHEVNIAQARELIRCFAVAFYESHLRIDANVELTWLVYAIKAYHAQNRKSKRKPTKRKKK